MISRRQFAKQLGAMLAIIGVGKLSIPRVSAYEIPTVPKIGDLITASWDKVRDEVCHPWMSPFLNQATAEGKIKFLHLSKGFESPNGSYYHLQYNEVPIIWAGENERKNKTEDSRVRLITALITNGLASHEDVFEEIIRSGDGLAVSTVYHHKLSEVWNFPAHDGSMVKIYTMYAKVPLIVAGH